jgi:hypothetical protein
MSYPRMAPNCRFRKWPAETYSKRVVCVVIGGGLPHNDSRFILIQANVPYVQLGLGRMYCLSPGARESWGVTSFRVEDEFLGFRSGLVPFPRRLTLPFIVQGGLLYRGTKGRKER